ncbi:MAG: hypothetical protein K2X32_06860 [Phycisphaerales bacterium]|nr:hypothetical protein [Phycisphaerales bacterium]
MKIRDIINDPAVLAQFPRSFEPILAAEVFGENFSPLKVYPVNFTNVANGAEAAIQEVTIPQGTLFVCTSLLINAGTNAGDGTSNYNKRHPVTRFADGALGQGAVAATNVAGRNPSLDAIEVKLKVGNYQFDDDNWIWAPAFFGRADDRRLDIPIVMVGGAKFGARVANRSDRTGIPLDVQIAISGFSFKT